MRVQGSRASVFKARVPADLFWFDNETRNLSLSFLTA